MVFKWLALLISVLIHFLAHLLEMSFIILYSERHMLHLQTP